MNRKKVYFMAVWGDSSTKILNQMKNQTPNCSGIWKEVEGTDNPKEADFFIIQDYTEEKIYDPARTIYFAREPDGAGPFSNYDHMGIRKFSWKEHTAFLYTKWVYPSKTTGGVNTTFDSLISNQTIPEKTKKCVCIQSHKTYMPGHALRTQFIFFYMKKHPGTCDLFGTIRENPSFKPFLTNNGLLPNNCKFETLQPYQYSLSFDNGSYPHFFGTQITDTFLSFVCPIYSGCPDLEDFFPEKSFIRFDAKNFQQVNFINKVLLEDNFDERKEAIKEARNLILTKYNMWESVREAVIDGKITWGIKK